MDPLRSVSAVQRKIETLVEKRRFLAQKLERAVEQKKDGARFYQGTELPIDDAIFSIREGQVRSLEIALSFYRETLNELSPPQSMEGSGGSGMTF